MGQPITLHKGSQMLVVYGRHQALIHLADGWQLAGDDTVATTAVSSSINATDGALTLAKENSVDLSQIKGSGKDGRILVSDVRLHLGADD